MALSTGSPCAACKFLRRKCTAECIFAPYFPPEDPQKFANVHKLFGASNVGKLLIELPLCAREDAVNSLAYEADARMKDPVYGCAGAISILQCRVAQLQEELMAARSELCRLKAQAGSDPLEPQKCRLPSEHLLPSYHSQLYQLSSPYITSLIQPKQEAVTHASSPITAVFSCPNPTASATPSFCSPNLQASMMPCTDVVYSASRSTFSSPAHLSKSLPNCKELSTSPSLSSSTLSFFNMTSSAAASTFALSDRSSGVGQVHASCDAD
ncbi:hypothetical protein GOP47_0002218 [Adiantum capillus-veneris]|uniref:LOB domain-containing protein n=1 Tax=Adiantum capillus-veneris TaxID=13818 RepID=A0A9D4VAJ5_ADICA|nr:hypothetical protein GOP47_0002218 [Adiantum capillus-veneris]